MTHHRIDAIEGLEAALRDAGAQAGLIFAARVASDDGWEAVEAELERAFELTRDAFGAARPIVYLVRQADLLGQDGAPGAMLASALLSAARALASEDRDGTTQVNVLAYDDPPAAGPLAGWALSLLEQPGVTGELISVGRSHLGRVLA